MRAYCRNLAIKGATTAFVPTMGFLHKGHLSLMEKGKTVADKLLVSIFINPAQFGPGEDLDSYPQNIEKDLLLTEKQGADAVFIPRMKDLYPDGYETYINLEKLPGHLCGISRPVFFRGVATIVTKLFNIIRPDIAIFGEKDYQQLIIIKQMVKDLNLGVNIIGSPTVREPDGLAMSSRNAYLAPEQRESALSLFRALKRAEQMVKNGETDTARILKEVTADIQACPHTEIDYIRLCDPHTLENVDRIKAPVRMALAVKVGKARLIDNKMLEP